MTLPLRTMNAGSSLSSSSLAMRSVPVLGGSLDQKQAVWDEVDAEEGTSLRMLSPSSSTDDLIDLVDEYYAPVEASSTTEGSDHGIFYHLQREHDLGDDDVDVHVDDDDEGSTHSSSAALGMLSSRRNAEFQETDTDKPLRDYGGWHVTLKMVKHEPPLLSNSNSHATSISTSPSSSLNASPLKQASQRRFHMTSSQNEQVLSQATAILLNDQQDEEPPIYSDSMEFSTLSSTTNNSNHTKQQQQRDRRSDLQRWDSEESMKSADWNIHEEERAGEAHLEQVASLDDLMMTPRSQQQAQLTSRRRGRGSNIVSCLKTPSTTTSSTRNNALQRTSSHREMNQRRVAQTTRRSNSLRDIQPKRHSVRFATNSQHPNRVWCLQQTIERVPPERRPCLWYSKQEITDLRLADEELHAELCQDDYAPALETALVNTSSLSEDNELDDRDEHALVAFSFATYCQGNAARGMEQRALASVFDDLVTRHRNAILDTQAMIRNQTLVGLGHDDHWEMLSLFSQKHARACKVLAAQLGQWDAALVELFNSDFGNNSNKTETENDTE